MAREFVIRLNEIESMIYKRDLEEAEKARAAANQALDNFIALEPWSKNETSPHPSMKRQSFDVNCNPIAITVDNFQIHAVLGRGTFGKVMLVSEKYTGNYYALKSIIKDQIIKRGDVHAINMERQILQIASASRHPFLLNLHSCFQSNNRLFFVMEYAPGGVSLLEYLTLGLNDPRSKQQTFPGRFSQILCE
jgi:hypothetical protein